jgi:hypothetical protein
MLSTTNKLGILLGVFMSAIFFIQYLLGVHLDNQSTEYKVTSWISFAVISFVIFYGIKSFYNNNDNFEIVHGLKTGIAIALISGLIYWLFQTIHLNFIEPDFKDKMAAIKLSDYKAFFPKATPKEIDVTQKNFYEYFHLNHFAGLIIPSILIGFAVSMISSFILKSKSKNS